MSYSNIFSSIYDNYGFGGEESRSGPGSTLSETEKIREKIKNLVKYKEIKSVVDIPCGDFNWMKEVNLSGIDYIGGDIVPKLIEENKIKYSNFKFEVMDVTTTQLPKVDLVFVRDCLGHLSDANVLKAVENIKKSGSKYLLTTSFTNHLKKISSENEEMEV